METINSLNTYNSDVFNSWGIGADTLDSSNSFEYVLKYAINKKAHLIVKPSRGKFWYIKRINTGNESSNYFQQENRWSVDGTISPGPLRTWRTEKFMTTLMGCAYTMKFPKIDKAVLRTMLGLRKYICSQFKPNAAKALYDYFDVKNVLDFSAGWGDRLAGFYASLNTELYVGLDPRVENHPIYHKQAQYYDKSLTMFENEKKAVFHDSPAEDFDYSEYTDTFDITSYVHSM